MFYDILEWFTCPTLCLCRPGLFFSQGMATRAVLLFQDLMFLILDVGSSCLFCFSQYPSNSSNILLWPLEQSGQQTFKNLFLH